MGKGQVNISCIILSTKQIEDQANWAIEEKPGDNFGGDDPFTLRNREKKFQKAKQNKKELKNKLSAKEQKDLKTNNKNHQKNQRLNNEKSLLNKTLEVAQKSTVSMGNFDKKLKNEPEIKKVKKKVNPSLYNTKSEKERDKKILKSILEKNK